MEAAVLWPINQKEQCLCEEPARHNDDEKRSKSPDQFTRAWSTRAIKIILQLVKVAHRLFVPR